MKKMTQECILGFSIFYVLSLLEVLSYWKTIDEYLELQKCFKECLILEYKPLKQQ